MDNLTKRLIVEGDQLTASVPEHVRHEVGRVDTSAFWKYPTQLSPVIFDKFDRILPQQIGYRIGLVERGHFERAPLPCKKDPLKNNLILSTNSHSRSACSKP